MKNKNRKPLIRKKYSFFDFVGIIFSKAAGGKSGRELHLPGAAATIGFRSVSSSSKNRSSEPSALSFSREQILSAMNENDLRGFGGAGFPMARKLKTVLASGVPGPVLIINGVECDPGLYHDKWILENKQNELEKISQILKTSLGLSGIYLAKKAGSPPVNISGVTSVDVPDIYPAGEETRLVSWLLGTECRSDEYPAGKGIWVQNVQSLLVLYSVLCGSSPRRYLTMTDLDRKHAVVVECDPDASVGRLADEIFGQYDQLYLGGGIMQGFPADGSEMLDSSINMIAAGTAARFSDNDCRRCGQCTRHCPAELPVEDLAADIIKGVVIAPERLADCSRCGACSFLCPAGIDLCSLIADAAACTADVG